MSLGATTSAPASAWHSDWRMSAATVSSFRIRPSGATMPSCPSLEYGSRATSVITVSSGTASWSAAIACGTSPRGFQASSASGDFWASGILGNSTTALTPRAHARRASSTSPDGVWRMRPGMAAIGSSAAPSCRKRGRIRSSGRSAVSRTRARMPPDLRLRRGRAVRSRRVGIRTLRGRVGRARRRAVPDTVAGRPPRPPRSTPSGVDAVRCGHADPRVPRASPASSSSGSLEYAASTTVATSPRTAAPAASPIAAARLTPSFRIGRRKMPTAAPALPAPVASPCPVARSSVGKIRAAMR